MWAAHRYTGKLLFYQSFSLGTVTTQRLDIDSDGAVTIVNSWQHGDYTPIGSSVTVLPAVNNGDYTVTVQSPCCHSTA